MFLSVSDCVSTDYVAAAAVMLLAPISTTRRCDREPQKLFSYKKLHLKIIETDWWNSLPLITTTDRYQSTISLLLGYLHQETICNQHNYECEGGDWGAHIICVSTSLTSCLAQMRVGNISSCSAYTDECRVDMWAPVHNRTTWMPPIQLNLVQVISPLVLHIIIP